MQYPNHPFTDEKLTTLAHLAAVQVECAQRALTRPTKGDVALALRREETINALERAIVRRCEEAPSLHALMQVRAAKDLERIGDEAKKIIAKSLIVHGENFIALSQVPAMTCISHHALQSIQNAVNLLSLPDPTKARALIAADLEIDAELDEVMLISVEMMHANPMAARSTIDTVLIAKAWERIGDHSKNLAENVLDHCIRTDREASTPTKLGLVRADDLETEGKGA